MSKKTIEKVGDVAAAAGLAASAGFVAWVVRDLESSFGPSPKKAERERLALTADQLEEILESRRRTAERYQQKLRGKDLEAQRRRIEYRAFAERLDDERRREERLTRERQGSLAALAGSLGESARELGRRADRLHTRLRPKKAEHRARMELRRELALHTHNFGREELERGEAMGVLTPGEQELLGRMRRDE